jgi:hypothetical protein
LVWVVFWKIDFEGKAKGRPNPPSNTFWKIIDWRSKGRVSFTAFRSIVDLIKGNDVFYIWPRGFIIRGHTATCKKYTWLTVMHTQPATLSSRHMANSLCGYSNHYCRHAANWSIFCSVRGLVHARSNLCLWLKIN